MRPPAEQGFTLIELLVALAVFSLAVLALLNLAGESTRTATALDARALAAVVADNQAVEAVTAVVPPTLGVADGVAEAGSRRWRWTRRVSRTADVAVLRIDVRVADPGGGAVAEVTAFRSAS